MKISLKRFTSVSSSRGLLLLLLVLASCEFLQVKDKYEETGKNTSKPIARVYDKYLYPSDLDGMVRGKDAADSASIVERYLKSWIRKQLLINEAEKNIAIDEAEIQRKILDYRYALIVYEYEKYYVSQNLETQIDDEAIRQYYEGNLDNFQLKQNIIKGLFVKVSKDAPKTNRIPELISSNKKSDRKALKTYCYSYADNYLVEDTVWVNFQELVKNTPFEDIPNKVNFLKNNTYVEESDDDYLYFLDIREYKIQDQISPVEFVKDDIRNILVNRRKTKLIQELENEVYNRAQESKSFEIFK